MPTVKIESLTVAKIKVLLQNRGLNTVGGKHELILRLSDAIGGDNVEINESEEDEVSQLHRSIASLAAVVEKLGADVRALTDSGRQLPIQTSTPITEDNRTNPFGNERSDYRQSLHSARDVIDLLPDFDPRVPSSLSANAFLKRVTQMMSAYGWDDTLVIFAMQAKFKGPAKLWVDSSNEVFNSFGQFSREFLRAFPDSQSVADFHLRMAADVRKVGETVLDYFFRMCSEGKRGELTDESIIQYIRRGLNYPSLQNAISCLNFRDTNELYLCLSRFVSNTNKVPETKPPKSFPVPSSVQWKSADAGKNTVAPMNGLCYNCKKPGHISINCPNPQRRNRCVKCQKVGHTTEKCPKHNEGLVNRLESVPDHGQHEHVTIQISLNDQILDAFVDPGSTRSLIRKSEATNTTECAPIALKGFGGATYLCEEMMHGKLLTENCTISTDLLVVRDDLLPCPVLLGTDSLLGDSRRVIFEPGICLIEDMRKPDVTVQTELSQLETKEFEKVLTEFRECFANQTSEMGRSKSASMSIKLTSDKPVQSRPYRIPFAKRAAVEAIIEELLTHDIIRRSESAYSSPIVLVKKQTGEDRLCVDFRALNAITKKIPFPMPTVEEILAQLSGYKFYITLDLFSGYYQIPLDESSRQYTAFVTHNGHFEYNVMPFGLVNAPMIFQQMITRIVHKLRSKNIISYMDEVIITSNTVSEGIKLLSEFLSVLKEERLTLRTSKCVFFGTEVSFLGHTISGSGIQPGSHKVNAIVNFPAPTNVREVRGFLGLTGFFRKFIRDYATIARPMTELLKTKNQPKFEWKSSCENAFMKLKSLLSEEPILMLYNPAEFHQVHTDASSIGLAAVLLQSPDQLTWKPVFYFSRQCNEAERNYHSHELEVLAIVEALERFKFYLLGKHFCVVTDCQAITTTKLTTPLNSRIARWWLKLQEFDFAVIHRAGNRMPHVDALSRNPIEEASVTKSVAENVLVIGTNEDDWLLAMQKQDSKLQSIIDILRNEATSPQSKQIKKEYTIKGGRLMRHVEDGLKFVVPTAVRWRIVRSCHDEAGHTGCEGTIKRIQKFFWFPRMRYYVKSYIAACIDCCLNKIPTGKREGRMFVEDVTPIPFRVLHVDHLGPFPKSKRGNVHLIALVDPFTKFTILRAVRDTSAKYVITMLRDVTTFFGLPMRIISDRGSAFTSKEFSEFCHLHDIQHVQIPVRTPRANGQVERINHTVLTKLRCSTVDRKDWEQHLPMIQWALNSQPHSTTGFSPNQLVFDFQLRDVTANRVILALNDDDATNSTLEIRQIAADRIKHEKQRWKQRFDSKHKKPYQYEEGDLIVVDNVPAARGESLKLEPKYKGPFQIAKVLRHDRYVVEDLPDVRGRRRGYSSIYTTDRMKPWCHLSPDIDYIDDDDNENRDDSLPGVAELSSNSGNAASSTSSEK